MQAASKDEFRWIYPTTIHWDSLERTKKLWQECGESIWSRPEKINQKYDTGIWQKWRSGDGVSESGH